MPITITLNDKDLDKYPSLHSRMIDELEDELANVVFKAGFIDFTLDSSYTGNSIRDILRIGKTGIEK